MLTVILSIIALLLGLILGLVLGYNAANTKQVVQSTTTRHNIEFNHAIHAIDNRLAAMPEELVNAVREAFPQLYDGPKQ